MRRRDAAHRCNSAPQIVDDVRARLPSSVPVTIVSRKTKPLQSCRQLPVFVAISTGQKLPKAKPVPSQEPQRPDGAPWSLLVRTTTACIHYKKLFNL
jgi:hypothetical protein